MRRPATFDMLGAVALCAATVIGVQAQQPPGSGQAAGGGRGGGPDPGALSVLQQLALNREMTIPSAITAAQTAAAAALVQASLTLPVNTAVSGRSPIADGARGRVGTQKSFRGVRTNNTKYGAKWR